MGEEETGPAGAGVGDAREVRSSSEAELLAAFDRLRPQGSLNWGFDDAMRRLAERVGGKGTPTPWDGLPDDLWDRGRTARVGQRFVGDVAGVLAELLAADARKATDAALGDGLGATWDALRYLAARLERLESRADPADELVPDLAAQVPLPDASEWTDALAGWFAPVDPAWPVVVGEADSGVLTGALAAAGHRVVAVEPRGAAAWRAMEGGQDTAVTVVLGEALVALAATPGASASGALLTGAVDRLDLSGKLSLLHHAVRIVRPGGVVVVLAVDQGAWEGSVPVVARDLAPGRPLHPETWLLLLRRLGVDGAWSRPSTGSVHAVVGRLPEGVVRR